MEIKEPIQEEEIDSERERIREIIDEMFKKKEPRRKPAFKDSRTGKMVKGLEESAFAQSMKLSEDLIKIGPRAVKVIMDALMKRVEDKTLPPFEADLNYGSPVFHLMDAMKKIAEDSPAAIEGYAKELTEILLDPNVLYNPNRSTRGIILEILEKVGDASIVPALEKYKEKVKKVIYYVKKPEGGLSSARHIFEKKAERFSKEDQEQADKVIEACKKRKD